MSNRITIKILALAVDRLNEADPTRADFIAVYPEGSAMRVFLGRKAHGHTQTIIPLTTKRDLYEKVCLFTRGIKIGRGIRDRGLIGGSASE